MGSHRTAAKPIILGAAKFRSHHLPDLPNNVGKKCRWKSIDGKPCTIKIEEEIYRLQSDNHRKAIVLQKMKHLKSGKTEYRLGYYMIGVRPRMRGKWTWGQFATIIPAKDLKMIIGESKKRKWL